MVSSQFCSVPFRSLLIEPDGKVGLCRMKGGEHEIGNIKNNSILEIWNGAYAQAWRTEFLNGQPQICKTKIRHSQCNRCADYCRPLPENEITAIQKRMPRRIAFNLNGKCNLECNMCHIWQKPNGLYDQNGFWDQLQDLTVDLEEVELLSGEPFIQKDTYRLIDRISELRPDCEWSITTNVNWKLTGYVKTQLDKIKFRCLIVSLDSLDPVTYPQIRKKGNLDLALKTLKDLKDYEQERLAKGLGGLKIHVNFLIQKLNWKELPRFIEFREEYGVDIFRTFLYEPFELSLLSLPEEERISVIEFYLKNLNRSQTSLNIILPILDSLPAIYRAQYFEHLKGFQQESVL